MKRVLKPLGLAVGLVFLLSSPTALAQAIAGQALAVFPPDTHQIAYVNFARLRSMPNYRQIEGAVLNRQALYFENFLRSIGLDTEKDVDEAVVGWRGDPSHSASIFGLATGRFDPAQVEGFITRERLAERTYDGVMLGASGPGLSSEDLFFAFLNPNLAAFGHLTDLEWLIDAYLGRRAALNSNADFVKWEGELEGSGAEWGITTGKAALGLAAPWLLRGQQMTEMAKLLAPVRAVLYSASWRGGFSTHIAVVCDNAQNAQTLARLLSFLRDAISAGGKRSPAEVSVLQSFDVESSSNRVEIEGSGPPDVFTQALRNSRAP